MGQPFKKILVPTDFSGPSEAALKYARDLIRSSGGVLHLLHVLDDRELRGVLGEGYIGPSPRLSQRELLVEQEASDRLGQLLDDGERQRRNTRLTVVRGEPVREILCYVQQHDIDLVVMGTHGRTGLVHVLLGSVAENVVRRCVCPVLTVHGAEQAAVT